MGKPPRTTTPEARRLQAVISLAEEMPEEVKDYLLEIQQKESEEQIYIYIYVDDANALMVRIVEIESR